MWNRVISAERRIVSDRWESGGGSDLAAPLFGMNFRQITDCLQIKWLVKSLFFPPAVTESPGD